MGYDARVRRAVAAVLLAVVAAVSAGGCTTTHAAAAPAPGLRHLVVNGRDVLVWVPAHLGRPAPLVLALGGIGSTARSELADFRLAAVAGRAGAVVAYPSAVRGRWNAGSCCWGATGDDVRYLSAVRERLATEFRLDPLRQVLLGYSNGGMLAYDAACADRHWTGIAVLGASLMTRCTPNHPFSITNVNGTLDDVAPWNGGWSGYTGLVMPAVWRIDGEFAGVFGCAGPATTRPPGTVVSTYTGCRGGVVVRDIQVIGLRHHWPVKEKDGYDMGPQLWHLALG